MRRNKQGSYGGRKRNFEKRKKEVKKRHKQRQAVLKLGLPFFAPFNRGPQQDFYNSAVPSGMFKFSERHFWLKCCSSIYPHFPGYTHTVLPCSAPSCQPDVLPLQTDHLPHTRKQRLADCDLQHFIKITQKEFLLACGKCYVLFFQQ